MIYHFREKNNEVYNRTNKERLSPFIDGNHVPDKYFRNFKLKPISKKSW